MGRVRRGLQSAAGIVDSGTLPGTETPLSSFPLVSVQSRPGVIPLHSYPPQVTDSKLVFVLPDVNFRHDRRATICVNSALVTSRTCHLEHIQRHAHIHTYEVKRKLEKREIKETKGNKNLPPLHSLIHISFHHFPRVLTLPSSVRPSLTLPALSTSHHSPLNSSLQAHLLYQYHLCEHRSLRALEAKRTPAQKH